MHCLDFQVAPTSTEAQQSSLAVERYAKALQQLAELEEERDRVGEKIALMEQVATLTGVNLTVTTQLVEAMLQEAAKLRKELECVVRMIFTNIVEHYTIL